MKPNDPIRIGVLGLANIAQRSVIPAIYELPGLFALNGIASRSLHKAKQFDGYTEKVYGSYKELLDSSTIDAVYIPLPNSLHAEWVEYALKKNIHVLVEKSLGCTFKEVENLTTVARRLNLVLLENFQFRFHSQLTAIQQMLREDLIGELRCIRSSFGFPPFTNAGNIRYQSELGGGSLLDAGAYPIKIAQIFLGENIDVTAASLYINPKYGVDTWGGGFLQQRDGCLFAEVAFGFDNYYQCDVEFWGSKGKLIANRIFTAPPTCAPEILIKNSDGIQTVISEPDNHFVNMLSHFHSLVLNRTPVEKEHQQNINQARLLEKFKLLAHA